MLGLGDSDRLFPLQLLYPLCYRKYFTLHHEIVSINQGQSGIQSLIELSLRDEKEREGMSGQSGMSPELAAILERRRSAVSGSSPEKQGVVDGGGEWENFSVPSIGHRDKSEGIGQVGLGQNWGFGGKRGGADANASDGIADVGAPQQRVSRLVSPSPRTFPRSSSGPGPGPGPGVPQQRVSRLISPSPRTFPGGA